ncbi:MAG: DUF2007 domain-containing protein [bacterium]
MDINWKAVRSFRFGHEAELARSILENEGIEAIVADATTLEMDWLLSNAIGYTKVQVPAADLDRARAILASHDAFAATMDEAATDNICLACQSPMAETDDNCPRCGWSYEELAEPAATGPAGDGSPGVFSFFQRNRRLIMASYFLPIIGPVLVTLIVWLLFGVLL